MEDAGTNISMCATEVFQILRSYDYTVMMYDDNGNQIYEPENARRLWTENENLLVSLVEDKSEGEVKQVRLYLAKSTKTTEVFGLIQTLRTTTTKYAKSGTFTVKQSGRENIKVSDFATRSSVTEAGRNAPMNILEGMYGTTRSSYLKLENARMIVRHSKKIDDTVVGSRGRHIVAIFIENVQGERFLFPTQQLAPARAMAQHVNHGGGFADMVGEQIIRMAHDYSNLGAASGYIAQNSAGLQESAIGVRETCRARMHEMRKCFERLSRTSTGYINESQRIEEKCKTLTEGAEETIIDITEVKNLLTLEDRELSETVLMSIAEAIKECECDKNKVDEYKQEPDARTKYVKDEPCPACGGSGNLNSKLCNACDGSGVKSISVLGKKIASSAWNDLIANKLDLYNPITNDSSDKPTYTNKDAELSYKIGQIVPEVKNDSMSSFLGFVSERLPRNNDAKTQKGLRLIAMSVIKLVGMPLDDGISANHVAVKEFSEWLAGFNSSIIFERDEDDYEYDRGSSFGGSDPTSYEYAAGEEASEEAISEIVNDFDINDFLESHGSDFGWGNLPDGGDLDYEKSYILRSLASYLEQKAQDEYGIEDADMSDSAAYLWDKIEPTLIDAGYVLSEGEFSRADVIIQTSQGEDLQREVSKSASTDPITGEMRPTDLGYMNRLRTLANITWHK